MHQRDHGATASLSSNPAKSAVRVGLRYVCGADGGIARRRAGKGFVYLNGSGKPIRSNALLKRIHALAIPPAWTNVWICDAPNGHIQAIGYDAKGRKQYIYHPKYRDFRDKKKFDAMVSFGRALPRIRKAVSRDLRLPGLAKPKVLATVVRLLEVTCMRIGNDQYAKENQSFGLTTLQVRHVRVRGAELELKFRGKSGQFHEIALHDERLARIVRKMHDLPGHDLFEYVGEDGRVARISSGDINAYLHEITGDTFTAKDFRTWYGSVSAIAALEKIGPAQNATELKRNLGVAVKETAARLGNRPSASRKYYIHPKIFEAYSDSTLFSALEKAKRAASPLQLQREEQAFIKLIGP